MDNTPKLSSLTKQRAKPPPRRRPSRKVTLSEEDLNDICKALNALSSENQENQETIRELNCFARRNERYHFDVRVFQEVTSGDVIVASSFELEEKDRSEVEKQMMESALLCLSTGESMEEVKRRFNSITLDKCLPNESDIELLVQSSQLLNRVVEDEKKKGRNKVNVTGAGLGGLLSAACGIVCQCNSVNFNTPDALASKFVQIHIRHSSASEESEEDDVSSSLFINRAGDRVVEFVQQDMSHSIVLPAVKPVRKNSEGFLHKTHSKPVIEELQKVLQNRKN